MSNDSNITVKLRLLGRAAFRAEATGSAKDLSALERAGQRVNRSLQGMGTAGVAAAGGIGVVAAALSRMGAGANMTQDRQMVAFETMLRSRRRAQQMVRDIKQLAKDSPALNVGMTGNAVQSLLAFGVKAKGVLGLVEAIGEKSTASGRSIEEVMPRAALAIGQIQAKGKLSAEELMQLSESIALSQSAVARELGMTGAELNKTFMPGKQVSAARAIPAIQRALVATSKGAMKRARVTTENEWNALQDQAEIAAGDITRPFYNAIGDMAGKVGKRLEGIQSSGVFERFSKGLLSGKGGGAGAGINKTLGKIVGGAKQAGRAVMDAFAPAGPFLQNVLLPVLGGVAKGVGGSVLGAFKAVLFVIKPVMQALGWFGEKVGPKAKGVFESVGKVLGLVFGGAILKVLSFLPKLGFAVKIVSVPLRVLEGILKFVGKALGFVGKAVSAVTNPFRGAFASVMTAIGNKLSSVGDTISNVVGKLRSVAAALGLISDNQDQVDESASGTTTTASPAPKGRTPKNKAASTKQRRQQKKDTERAFPGADVPLVNPGGKRQGVAGAGDTVINFNVDGKTFHTLVVDRDRKNGRGK